MKITFRKKVILSFLAVIAITGLFSTFVGIKLIDKSIQDKVRLDLNSAREIFQGRISGVQDVIRLTSTRFFLRESTLNGDIERLTVELQKIRQKESLDIMNLADFMECSDKHLLIIVQINVTHVFSDERKNSCPI